MAGPVGPGAAAGRGFTTRPDTVPGLEAALFPAPRWRCSPVRMPGEHRTGRGSSGKTQLAARLADSLWQSREADLLGWVAAGSRASILSGYLQLPRT